MTHIRKPWRRGFSTSSSGYVRRALSNPPAETLCGDAPTDRDAGLRDWRAYQKAGEIMCERCIAIVEGN